MKSYFSLKNLHLLISIVIVIPAGLMYGLYPEEVLSKLLDIKVYSVDLRNIFRAIMCLYIGIAAIWILGVFRPEYWKFATLLAILFMGSLATGRMISFILDGKPSLLFTLGLFGEMILAIFSIFQLKMYKK